MIKIERSQMMMNRSKTDNSIPSKPMTNKSKPKSILRKRRYKRPPTNKTGVSEAPEKVKSKQQLKFAGPIKIIVIEPKTEYCKIVWCAIGIGLANIAIGAVLMTVLHYSITSGDAHAVVCCLAFHFFSAEAILALHYANGWSSPMRIRHRKFAHIFLHLCGIVCAIIGTIVVAISKGITEQPHGLTGVITLILFILNALIGPFAYIKKKKWLIIMHLSFGIAAFIMSSISVCFGLVIKSFKDWASDTIVFILITFVMFYTLFIITSSFMKCMTRI